MNRFGVSRGKPGWTLSAALVLLFLSIGLFDRGRGIVFSSLHRENPPGRNRAAILPGTMLWAWERPEDLRFIDTRAVGVAFLSRTCRLSGDETTVVPRLQPLEVSPGCFLEAVVRIECDRRRPPSLSTGQKARLLQAARSAAGLPGVKALQIDFDARRSQRNFYKDLLLDLRRILPDDMPLSVTALASWCMGDSWLASAPVDEVVPMAFRMGADRIPVRLHLAKGEGFPAPACGRSIGFSTDEFLTRIQAGVRIYVFNPESWTKEALDHVFHQLDQNEVRQ